MSIMAAFSCRSRSGSLTRHSARIASKPVLSKNSVRGSFCSSGGLSRVWVSSLPEATFSSSSCHSKGCSTSVGFSSARACISRYRRPTCTAMANPTARFAMATKRMYRTTALLRVPFCAYHDPDNSSPPGKRDWGLESHLGKSADYSGSTGARRIGQFIRASPVQLRHLFPVCIERPERLLLVGDFGFELPDLVSVAEGFASRQGSVKLLNSGLSLEDLSLQVLDLAIRKTPFAPRRCGLGH